MTSEDSRGRVLHSVLDNHRPELVQHLDCSRQFLTRLAKFDLIDPGGVSSYERIKSREERNRELVDELMSRGDAVEDGYSKLLDALRYTRQNLLAATLTNVDKEINLVSQYQDELAGHLRTVDSFLTTESRRTEVRFADQDQTPIGDHSTEMPPPLKLQPLHSSQLMDREEMTEFLYRVHQTTKSTLQQFDRCREVIDKLHRDCDDVARKNADTLSKLRDCEHMVASLMPAVGLEAAFPERTDDTSRPASPSGRSSRSTRKTEPEAIVTAVRKNLNALADELLVHDEARKRNASVLDNVTKDLRERRLAMSRYTDIPLRETAPNKYLVGIPQLSKQPARQDTLHYKVEELAEQMLAYVQQETQLTHKVALAKVQSGGLHRNFDQVDKELGYLQKELRRNDKDRALLFAANIIQSTKGEREDCMKMVDEIERNIHVRRLKLQEASSKSMTRLRRRPARKAKLAPAVESNFAKKLNDLNNEVKLYIDLELDQVHRFKSDMLRKKQEYENQIRLRQGENRELDKRLRQSQNEKDKYKKLYEQEKAINKAKKAQARLESQKAAAATERRGILKRQNHQQQQRLPDIRAPPENRHSLRRTVKPKLTPRARELILLREDAKHRKEARVRPMQLISEDELPRQNSLQPIKKDVSKKSAGGAEKGKRYTVATLRE